MKYLRALFTDALQFYGVPLVAALLPWRLARRWLRGWAARAGGPFDEAARAAAPIAPQHLDVGDAAAFAAAVRLVWLLDACDVYLSLTRWRRRWWPWHIERVGAWPQTGAFLAAGFHHGTGLWVFRSLAQSGRRSVLVSARWQRDDYRGLPLRYWYGRLRGWDVQRVSGNPVAFRPGVRDKLSSALGAGMPVVGVIDMPPRLAPRGQQHVRLLDRDASFPDGLLALARDAGVPVVPYWVDFDLQHCTRRFCIGAPLDPHQPAATLQALADILDRQIRRTPSAWFFWPEWPSWSAAPAPAQRADVANYVAVADTHSIRGEI